MSASNTVRVRTDAVLLQARSAFSALMETGIPEAISAFCYAQNSVSEFYNSQLSAAREHYESILEELRDMPDNWDGYGAVHMHERIIDRAKSVVERLNTLPTDIVPHPAGTVMLEWETPQGRCYLEVGLTVYNFYAKRRGGEAFAHVGPSEQLDDLEKLGEFSKRVRALAKYPSMPTGVTNITYVK